VDGSAFSVRDYLTPLIQLQRFFLPVLVGFLLWASWRTVWRRDLAVGLGLYLALVIIVDGFMNTGIFLPGLEKGSIRYSELCAGFLLFSRPPAAPRQSPYFAVCVFVTLYFLLLFVSVFRTDELMGSFFEFRRLIIPQIISFLIAMRGVRSGDDFRRLFLCMMALSIVIGLFIFFDLFFDRWLITSDMLFTPEYGVNRRHGRFGSFFLNPNYLGAFVVLTFPVAFVWTLGQKGWLKALGGIGLLALVFCLVETQSRGPLLTFGLTVLLVLVGPAGDMSRGKRLAVFMPFVVVLLLLMPGFLEHAAGRFDTLDQEMTTETARTRQTVWTFTERAIADNPLFGIGFGEHQFLKVINQQYGFEDRYGESSLDNPHNSYLQMTVYAGFPVLMSFLAANVLMLFRAARSVLQRLAERQTHVAFGLTVGVAGFLGVIYPDMHMFTQTVAPVYWVFFGLLLSMTTTIPQWVEAVKPYEDSRAYVGNAGQHLARESAAAPPQHRWDRDRAATAGTDRSRQGRTAPADDPPVRDRAHGQQAAVQLDPLARPSGVRGEDRSRQPFPWRRTPDVRPPGADARRRKY
jgi:O-antigen ligase